MQFDGITPEDASRIAVLRERAHHWTLMIADAIERRDYLAACGYVSHLAEMTDELRRLDR
jgi:hypothetical protein